MLPLLVVLLVVNSGQGFRSLTANFVLRLGVPHELSIMELHYNRADLK
jgi:hypothetical protein